MQVLLSAAFEGTRSNHIVKRSTRDIPGSAVIIVGIDARPKITKCIVPYTEEVTVTNIYRKPTNRPRKVYCWTELYAYVI